VPEDALALQRLVHLGTGGGKLLVLCHKGEHDRKRTSICPANQRLKLHPHDARFFKPHAHRPPAHGRVGFIRRLHVGQHLVRADIERAKDHAAALGRVHHAGIKGAQLGALGHVAAGEKLQFGAKKAHAVGPRIFQTGQVDHETRVHLEGDPRAAKGLRRLVADRGIPLLRLGLHRHLVTKGRGHGVVGTQVHNTLVAIDKDEITVERLGGDALGIDDQRNRQRARDDRSMRADSPLLEHDPAQAPPVIEQICRPDIARHEDGICRHLGAGLLALSGKDAQQPVGKVVEIVQPLAQIGVGNLFHPGAGGRLFLFHGGLGRQAAVDIGLHPAHPAPGIDEHPVGFEHLELILVAALRRGQHPVHADAQRLDRLVQALQLARRILGDGVGDDHPRLVQPDMALCHTLLRARALEHHRADMARLHRGPLADEGAKLGHLGQHHGDHLERIDLVLGEKPRHPGLDHQHAQLCAKPLDGNADEGGICLLAGLWHVAKAGGGGRVIGVDDLARPRDAPDKPLPQPQPDQVHGFGPQPLRGAKFKRGLVTKQVDRAHLGVHFLGNEARDPVQPRLPAALLCHDRAKPAEHLAAVGPERLAHRGCPPFSWPGPPPRADRAGVRRPCPAQRHHAAPAPQVPCISGRSARKSLSRRLQSP